MRYMFVVAALLLGACAKKEEGCVDLGDCAALEVCDLGTCVSVGCVHSEDCAIDEYCDDAAYTCEAGCGTDDDCRAGEDCPDTTHTCTTYGCRTSALDCAIGQECDVATGTCLDAAACETCTSTDPTTCGGGACVDFDASPDAVDEYCLQPCAVVADPEQCPRGLECRDLSGTGDLYCYADCPALQAELNEGGDGG